MKKLMLIACWACLAFSQTSSAQETKEENVHYLKLTEKDAGFNDTLVIRMKGNDKVLFIGDGFKRMAKYEKADSLKLLFITDLEKAWKDQTLSADAPTVYYFVHPSGKRRLKAETAEFSDNRIEPAYEIKRLQLDLPKFQYHIYDLSTGYQFQVYVSNPEQLKSSLNDVNLTDAIRYAGSQKAAVRKSYKMELSSENNRFILTDRTQGFQDMIEISPSIGAGLLGNTFAPVFGFDLSLRFSNKYTVGKYKMTVGVSAFPFVNMTADKISSVHFVRSYELRLAMNLNAGTRQKDHWFGLQGGLMKSYDISSYNNAFKLGVLYEGNGPFNYSFDFIHDRNSNLLYGLTVKLPF